MLAAAIGRPWNSRQGFLSWSIPTAHLTLAPASCGSSSEDEEEGEMRHGRNDSAAMGQSSLSVMVTVPCLFNFVNYVVRENGRNILVVVPAY
jgi:hypothetical protein